ncbi:MAG: hypothetical protein IIC73_00665 [Armatimonadetes bacterium]|nr:hypothetical protein [Armatimonadota bacterium]
MLELALKYIRDRVRAVLASALAFTLAVLIGHGGARAVVVNREYVGTQSPGDVWEWDLTSTKWDHQQNRWIQLPQDVPDAR